MIYTTDFSKARKYTEDEAYARRKINRAVYVIKTRLAEIETIKPGARVRTGLEMILEAASEDEIKLFEPAIEILRLKEEFNLDKKIRGYLPNLYFRKVKPSVLQGSDP